jgi:hypothetical protein
MNIPRRWLRGAVVASRTRARAMTTIRRGVTPSSEHLVRRRSRILMPAAAFTLPISIVTSDFSIDKLPRIRPWRSRGVTETRRRRTLGGMIGV